MEGKIWKTDIGIDELNDNEYRIIVYNNRNENIHVFGKTPEQCNTLGEWVANKLNQ